MSQWILGWAIRTLEDSTVLPATLLNAHGTDRPFDGSDTVELVWAPLTLQEEIDVWQIAQANRRPSASYVARMVAIESLETIAEHREVQTLEARCDTEVPA